MTEFVFKFFMTVEGVSLPEAKKTIFEPWRVAGAALRF
jgi:hypothetical protein